MRMVYGGYNTPVAYCVIHNIKLYFIQFSSLNITKQDLKGYPNNKILPLLTTNEKIYLKVRQDDFNNNIVNVFTYDSASYVK